MSDPRRALKAAQQPRLRDGRFGYLCPWCDGHGLMNAQAYCRPCDGLGVVERALLGAEFDEFGRRIWPHPEGHRFPLMVGHSETQCKLRLPHRGPCWPEVRAKEIPDA